MHDEIIQPPGGSRYPHLLNTKRKRIANSIFKPLIVPIIFHKRKRWHQNQFEKNSYLENFN